MSRPKNQVQSKRIQAVIEQETYDEMLQILPDGYTVSSWVNELVLCELERMAVTKDVVSDDSIRSYTTAEILTINKALIVALESSLLTDRIEDMIHEALGVL